jgi:hypothetical protein
MRSQTPQSPLRLPNLPSALIRTVLGLVVAVVIVLAIFGFLSDRFFYFLVPVEAQEVGVQFRNGNIYRVVGPGLYSDVGLWVKLERVSSQAIPFSVRDEEIITSDKQRIGLVVSGDVFQPNLGHQDVLQRLWSSYQNLYIDDEAAKARVQDLARQAMKVCVGERTFDNAIIGTARDDLRACIDEELSALAENIGLQIENVVVPEVVLSPEVQAALDAIVQSRLQTEKAAQDKLRVEAEAQAEQARQEGEVRVAQSRIQEETKQQTLLARLEQEKIAAQRAVIEAQKANELAQVEAERNIIEAQKANELLAAQQDLEINTAQALAAAEKAKADIAPQVVLAELYARNPGYLQLQLAQANASALKAADKIIFTPVGTTPTIVVPGPGIQPTVGTSTPQ